jgi:hypothetical protein
MIRKGTWIVLIIFIVLLGGAIYLNRTPGGLTFTQPTETISPTAIPRLLADWQADEIVFIELKGQRQSSADPDQSGATGTVTLTKEEDGSWTIGPDNNEEARLGTVENLRSQFATVRILSALDTSLPLDSAGLVEPQTVITLHSSNNRQVEIRIGGNTPTNSGYYVQVDSNPPVVVSTASVDAILSLFDPAQLYEPTPTPGSTATP